MSDAEEGTTVAVTSKGQATLPKAFREKLHIETPGRVRFVERDGEVVIGRSNGHANSAAR